MTFSELPAHHAILVTHEDRAAYASGLWKELSQLSPAHRYFDQTVLDIDTVRSIISWAQSAYNDERVALISFHTAGAPAQNAMLKILEEPRPGTRFVIVTTHTSNLIPTILSRVFHIHITSEKGNEEAKEFLATEFSLRMKLPYVVGMLAKTDEEGRKDRESLKRFLLSLVEVLRLCGVEPRYLSETLQVASYASDPSASGKALLEYVSLLLPRIK